MQFLKNLVFAVAVTLLLASFAAAQDSQKRSGLLTKRAGNRNIFQKTTTTTEANDEEEEYVEGDEVAAENEEQAVDEESANSSTTTTTESSKKIGPSVRPFRSNQDLLSALKKRRLSEKNSKPAVTQKPVQEDKQYEAEVKTTKAKPTTASSFAAGGNRRFGGHKSTNVKAPVQDNLAQTIEDPTSKPFKRSNRFSQRQNN